MERFNVIEFLAAALNQLGEYAGIELVAIVFAIAYVLLAARQNIWCWACAIVSTALYIFLYYKVSLLSESLLNVYYLLIAVYGWYCWRRRAGQAELPVTSWSLKRHIGLIVATAACVPVLGYWTSQLGAAYPYMDAATTCFAVSATWLVTRKILENWLYWIVIDAVSIYLNAARGLQLTALLFVAYTVLAVYGYWQWRRSIQPSIIAPNS